MARATRFSRSASALAGALLLAAPSAGVAAPKPKAPALQTLAILPRQVALQGPAARQLLVVTGHYADGSTRDLSRSVRYISGRPAGALVSPEGLVTPVSDGPVSIKAALGKVSASVLVIVRGAADPAKVSFARDVIPVLTRAGCNGLSCHGSPAGKAGFRLSMFGYDPALDHDALVKQDRKPREGDTAAPVPLKRLDPAQPEQSLALLKATAQVPHQGGPRFKVDSPEYRTLLAWLKSGAPAEAAPALSVARRLEVLPPERLLPAAGEKARLVVMAHYGDGTAEDVTHKSVWVSNDESVAGIDEGELEVTGAGETSVYARYQGRVGVAQVLIPQPGAVDPKAYAAFKAANYVDDLWLARWKKAGFVPADLCTDAEFLRRVSLDLTGTLPAPEEVRAFLADRSPDRRARKIDELLAKPEYADWWSVYWGDALRNNARLIQPQGAKAYRDWMRQSLAENKPYDQFVRELVTATGDTFTNGAANYYRVARTPTDLGEQTSQVFLGVRLQCAQCHNHPFEKWTRTGYHQFAALFARVRGQGGRGGETTVATLAGGELRHPETNEVMSPTVLEDGAAPVPAEGDRRDGLAAWLVSPQNPLFARNLVNRLWAQLFGRGLVDPVDDIRSTNPAVNEPLLDALAKDFILRKWDVRHMLRTLANSRTYQLSVQASPRNAADRQNFSRSYHRRLKAEPLLDALCQATGVPETFNGHPPGTRAIQLTDNRAANYFLDVFGRPRREVVCACEREETANLTQALHLINGSTLHQKLTAGNSRLAALLQSGKPDAEIVEELYLCSLSRPPTGEERQAARKLLDGAGANRRPVYEDLFWVLLNSREFLFNH